MLIQSESKGHYLTFDEDAHTYTLDGNLVCGVTGVNKMGFPPAHSLINWLIKQGAWYTVERLKECPEPVSKLPKYLLEEIVKKSPQAGKKSAQAAASIGSLLHSYAEAYESHNEEWLKTLRVEIDSHVGKEKINNCIKRFEAWEEENRDTIIGHEDIIASPTYQFAGKYDRLARRGKLTVLSDYKTSSGIYAEMFVQLAAYSIALEEWKDIKVDAIEILRFGKTDAEFETKIIKSKKDIEELKQQFIRNLGTKTFRETWE